MKVFTEWKTWTVKEIANCLLATGTQYDTLTQAKAEARKIKNFFAGKGRTKYEVQ